MPPRLPRTVVLAALALVATGCASTEADTTTTTELTTLPPVTTTMPPPTTTGPPPTTAPPARYTAGGEAAEGILDAIADLYSWIDDPRNPPPRAPEGLLAHLDDVELPSSRMLEVRANTGEMPNGDRIGVIHVGEDLVFMVRDGGGWRIVGAWLATSTPWLGDEPRLLLVLGSDARVGQNQLRFRADSIHLLGVAPTAAAGTILGFPRDTFVTKEQIAAGNEYAGLPESDLPPGGIKWTNLLASRGPDIMLGTARELTGLEIEGYVITGFKGFDGLISFLGGLIIELPRRMRSGNVWDDFSAGLQTLSPKRALQLARIRKGLPRGDFDRSFNQGLIMQAAMDMVQDMGIDALPVLIEVLLEHAWTDLDTEALFTIAAAAFVMEPEALTNVVLDGRVTTIAGASVVLLDEDEAELRYADLGADGILQHTGS